MCIRKHFAVKNIFEKSRKGGKTMDNANKNKINLALYIVLTLIVVAVVCMTVIGIVNGSKRGNELPSGTKATDRVTTAPKPNVTQAPETTRVPQQTEDNAPNEDVIVDTEGPSQDVDAPVKLKYTEPVSGYLLKGYDIDMPVYSLTMNDYRVHSGIDILADPGAQVVAVAEGTVQHVYDDPLMGHCVSINHANGLVSYYMGLSDELYDGITDGAPVYCGQPISSIGDSTLIEIAEEPHLHFEMKLDGKYVDPCDYVTYEASTSAGAVDDNYEG